jgi:hypothetical protein
VTAPSLRLEPQPLPDPIEVAAPPPAQLHQPTLPPLPLRDAQLRERLEAFTNTDEAYWSFRGNAKRIHAHAFFQYPAMMVPQMLSSLMSTIRAVYPEAQRIYDPFVGSGTTLTEAMLHGFDFTGGDINPLAILLCKTKAETFNLTKLRSLTDVLLERIRMDTSRALATRFPGRDKWFTPGVCVELSRIKRAIQQEPSKPARRFFWVALAETVRLTCNSRTSTFKLHILSAEDLEKRNVSAKTTFARILRSNLDLLDDQQRMLAANGHLERGRYTGSTLVRLENLLEPRHGLRTRHDVVITSPPYGDNRTTVPYGQSAYLPLQWIDLSDIDDSIDESLLDTTNEIDARSLGGSLKDAIDRGNALRDLSPTLGSTLDQLTPLGLDGAKRVATFCADLESTLPTIVKRTNRGGLMVWTVGNRSVNRLRIPIDRILTELLDSHGVTHVATLQREIASKRMPTKNQTSDTMGSERILVMRVGL